MPDAVKKVYDESGIKIIRDGCENEKRTGQSRSAFLIKQCGYFLVDYMMLDFFIYLMDRDPWFNRSLGSDERLLFGYRAGNLDMVVRPYRVFVGTLAIYSVMDLLPRISGNRFCQSRGEMVRDPWRALDASSTLGQPC